MILEQGNKQPLPITSSPYSNALSKNIFLVEQKIKKREEGRTSRKSSDPRILENEEGGWNRE